MKQIKFEDASCELEIWSFNVGKFKGGSVLHSKKLQVPDETPILQVLSFYYYYFKCFCVL